MFTQSPFNSQTSGSLDKGIEFCNRRMKHLEREGGRTACTSPGTRSDMTSVPRDRTRSAAAGWLFSIAVGAGMACVSLGLAAQTSGARDDLNVVQVRPAFYMLTGAGGNIAVQIGPAGVILVDAGAAGRSDAVLAAI